MAEIERDPFPIAQTAGIGTGCECWLQTEFRALVSTEMFQACVSSATPRMYGFLLKHVWFFFPFPLVMA